MKKKNIPPQEWLFIYSYYKYNFLGFRFYEITVSWVIRGENGTHCHDLAQETIKKEVGKFTFINAIRLK